MARKFLTNIDMNSNQILNLVLQTLGTDPVSPVSGQVWYNSATGQVKYYDGANSATVVLYDSASANTPSKLVLRDGSGNFSANVGTFNSVTISNTPSSGTDGVNESYVDSVIQGLEPKGTADYATTAALPTVTYSNGTSGVGATLTATSNGALSVDGGSPTAGMVVLVKDQASGFQNGLYTVTNAGSGGAAFVLTRATNFDVATEIDGAFVFVNNGTTNDNTGWLVSSSGPYTIGTTAIAFTQFTGANSITANAPLSKSGNAVSLSYTARLTNNGGSLDLASGVATAGSYALVTVDTYGRVTAGADIVGSTGVVVKTAASTYAARTISGTSGRITLSNGDGVSGNPTIDLASGVVSAGTYYGAITVDTYGRVTAGADISSATGLVTKTAAGTFTGRSIASGTGISVTNGSGVSGNPTVAIDTAVVARKYAGTITGDNSTTAFTVTHNLNTQAVQVTIRDSNQDQVEVDNRANAVNTVVLTFAVAPANSVVYNVIVMG